MNPRRLTLCIAVLAAYAIALIVPSAGWAISYPDAEIDARKMPWATDIIFTRESGSPAFAGSCSGTIIAKGVVLTAAHCVYNTPIETIYAGLPASKPTGSPFFCGAVAVAEHPRYTADNVASVNDIALIRLNKACVDAWPTKTSVRQVKLPSRNDSTLLRAPLVIYGWGVNQNGKFPKRLGYLRVTNYSSSGREIYGRDFNPAMHLAAGRIFGSERLFGGACNGDSGGPLIAWRGKQPYLVGVTSFGMKRCRLAAPTVFTRVSPQLGWIKKAIATTAAEAKEVLLNFGYTKKICGSPSGGYGCSQTKGWANIAVDKTTMIVNFDFPWTTPIDVDLDQDGKPDLKMDETGIHHLDGSTPPECAIVDTSVGWVYNTSCLRLPSVIPGPVYEFNLQLHGVVTITDYGDNVCPNYAAQCDRNFVFDIDYVTLPPA